MQKRLVILVLGTTFSFSAAAQSEKVFITDKISYTYAYVDVMKTYERIAAKDYKSVDLFQKLGDSSFSHFKLEKAAEWYTKLFSLTLDLAPEYCYRYAESLRFICEKKKRILLLKS